MKIFKSILFFINVIVVIFTILSYIAPYVDPSRFWFFSFFGLAFIYFIIINIIFVIIWFFIDKRRAILSLVILLIGTVHIPKVFSLSLGEKTKAVNAVKLMSYNINHGTYLYRNHIKTGVIGDYIKTIHPDILLLQETNSKYLKKDSKKLDFYKYKHTKKVYGAGIYTDYKIVNKGQIDFDLFTNSCLWADIKLGKDTVRVYSVHFMSNQISDKAAEILTDIEKDKTIASANVREVLSKYKTFVQKRAKQVNKVISHVVKSPYPVIVGGDFNDSPITYTYNRFSELLKDAFIEKGSGLGVSYNGVVPLLRIDYIFTSSLFNVHDFDIDRKKYSDHYPVTAVISLRSLGQKHQK